MTTRELFAYLTVHDAEQAIAFYRDVFGAVPTLRLDEPGGRRIGHAELKLGGTTLMLADEFPEYGLRSPNTIGGTSVTLHLHVDDADDVIRKAAEAGATVEIEPTDHFYGERSGAIRDPFGHRWTIGHTIEEVSPEDMQRRYDAGSED